MCIIAINGQDQCEIFDNLIKQCIEFCESAEQSISKKSPDVSEVLHLLTQYSDLDTELYLALCDFTFCGSPYDETCECVYFGIHTFYRWSLCKASWLAFELYNIATTTFVSCIESHSCLKYFKYTPAQFFDPKPLPISFFNTLN